MVWNEGYVAEIKYTYGFYGELSPLKLALASVVKSTQAPNSNKPFNYCELGCGRGYTTNLLASAYPHAQFYANDFNPSHIVEAKALAESANTQNVHFFDDSFAEFINQDLPQFDFIVLHGIYSWISKENRQEIINFIRKKLKVGGFVYVSYNTLPGWSAAMPLQALMLRHRKQSSLPILESIGNALNFTGELLEANAAYFIQNPTLKSRYEQIKQQNRHYLAHEYFNKDWNSFYFDEVAEELNEAKLNFVGSAQLLDNVDILNLSATAQTQLSQIKDPIYKEVVRDFFLNTQFRRDVFSRGQLSLSPADHTQTIQNVRYALIVSRSTVKINQKFAVGEVTLQPEVYEPICNLLAESSLTMNELHSHPTIANIPLNSLYQALIVLTGIGYIHPAVDDETFEQRKKSTDAFNHAVIQRALVSEEMNYLASPLVGTGIGVSFIEQLLLLAKSKNEDGVKFVWQLLSSQNKKLMKENKTLETPEENIEHIQTLAKDFYDERFLTLQKLGIQ